MSAPVLEASGLALDFGARRVFEDVSLTVAPGEIVALLGASGAGKSSLLRTLAGLLTPSRGAVSALGEPLRGGHPSVALAFQDPCLLPWRNVENNVAFGLDFASQPQLSRAERKRRVAEALSRVELSHAARQRPEQLSGGMAQRVALARCLAREPRVLLLDEPFGALDEVTRSGMQQTLLRVVRSLGTSVVLVTHDIDEALLLADRILLLGGSPARVHQEWTLRHPHPREDALPTLQGERLAIVSCLRATFLRPRPASDSHNYRD